MRLRSPVGLLLLAPAASIAVGCSSMAPWEPGAEEVVTYAEEFRDGEVFDLRNINGRVSITSWDRPEAEITAQKVGFSEAALARVEVEVKRTARGVRVRTVHRKSKMWGEKYGSVNYDVRLPQEADLRIQSVNGPVEMGGFTGEVRASTVNGALRLQQHRGPVRARTVNGKIECELAEFDRGSNHSLRTVNGEVRLMLDRDGRGRVDARTTNGRVEMDLGQVEHLESPTRRRKSVRFGGGEGEGGDCRVRTVNGAVHVAFLDGQ